MTAQAGKSDWFLCFQVDRVRDGVALNRVTESIPNRQNRHCVEVVLWKLHFSVKDRYQGLPGNRVRLRRIRTMARQAKSVDVLRSQQMLIVTAVRFVAGCAPRLKRGFVKVSLGAELGFIRVAVEADGDGIRVGQPR